MIFPRIREAKRLFVAAVNGISVGAGYQTTMRVRGPQRDADGAPNANDSRDALVKWAGFIKNDDSPIQFDYLTVRFIVVCVLNISDDDVLDLDDHGMVAAADIYKAVMAIERSGTPIRQIQLEDADVVDEDGNYAVAVSFIVDASAGADEPYLAQ